MPRINIESEGQENQFTSVFSVRSTLDGIEIMPQINESFEKPQ